MNNRSKEQFGFDHESAILDLFRRAQQAGILTTADIEEQEDIVFQSQGRLKDETNLQTILDSMTSRLGNST
ncbi:MAG: hypothetical protein ABI758_03970 [Candidatus Woesebacteria bacterium]